MRLIHPSFEILEQGPGLEGIYEAIERAGRICYKSTRPEGKTAKDFVDRMIASQHYAMLEHGTVYLKVVNKGLSLDNHDRNQIEDKYIKNPYSKVIFGEYPKYNNYEEKLKATQEVYITTNYRVLVENGWLDDLKYLCEPTEFHEKRVTVRFISNIHFYKDITRHRHMSFAIESTRYCNYSKDKFDNELTFIEPKWFNDSIEEEKMLFEGSLVACETAYLNLVKSGWKAQQAAEVLPQATKADIIMTGFVSDWRHVFDLRTSIIAATGKPHPEVSRLMDPLYEEFEKHLI